jgi:hypothetical protein
LTITISLALLVTFNPPGFAASGPVAGTDIGAALAQGKPPSPRHNNKKEANMKQDETIRSQKERQVRGPEYDRLTGFEETGPGLSPCVHERLICNSIQARPRSKSL